MTIPSFFIVGAAKAGTTSLFDYLGQHPSVYIPPMKEPHFFSDYVHVHAPRLRNTEEYLELFRPCRDDQIAGDLSTSYLYSVRAPGRIRELRPDARIVIVLRNPIDRAYSFYWYNRNHFVETLTFEEALDAEAQRIADGWHFRFHYQASGQYYEQVRRYLRVFGPEAVRVFLFEDLTHDASGLCAELLDFLGLPSDRPLRTDEVYNRSGVFKSEIVGRVLMSRFPGKRILQRLAPQGARRFRAYLFSLNTRRPPAMDPATRARLVETFRDDVDRVSGLLDRDLSHWLGTARDRAVATADAGGVAASPRA